MFYRSLKPLSMGSISTFLLSKLACSDSNEEDKDLKILNGLELKQEITKSLNSSRDKLKSRGIVPPPLGFLEIENLDNNIKGIRLDYFDRPSSSKDAIKLFSEWLKIIGNGSTISHDEDNNSMSIISSDSSSSLVLQIPQTSKERKVNESFLSLYTDGLTKEKIKHIVDGYTAATSTPFTSSGSCSSSTMNLDDITSRFPSFPGMNNNQIQSSRSRGKSNNNSDPIAGLESLGVEVITHSIANDDNNHDDNSEKTKLDWSAMAGNSEIKREVHETIIDCLKYPDVYDKVARSTRHLSKEKNTPKAVLFEGPPGTGKTLVARIISSICNKPMIIIRVESIVSKWYGDSEKKLGEILELANQIEGGSIIFIDEIDAMAGSRDNSSMHEATRRMLSVMLQHLEGFEGRSKSLLIAASNRKSDLDAALLSRFDLISKFDLPDEDTRKQIYSHFARHLPEEVIENLAANAQGFSARDIKEVCLHAERKWAAKIIRNNKKKGNEMEAFATVPAAEAYEEAFQQRKVALNRQNSDAIDNHDSTFM